MKIDKAHSDDVREAVPSAPKYGYPVSYWTRGLLRPYAGPSSRPWLLYDAIDLQLYTRSSDGDRVEVVRTDGLREFSVGDSLLGSRRTYRRYLNARLADPTLRTAFFEVRYDLGGSALLCQRNILVMDPHTLQNVRKGTTRAPARIIYFLKIADNNTLTPVALREDAVFAALGTAHKAELAAYARLKRLKLDRENDVITLLAYLDTL